MIKLVNWFFERLPHYFKKNDSLKDSNGKGTLERYLSLFGAELDDEVINYADGYIAGTALDANIKSIIDASECDPKYLYNIAYALGNPPDLFKDPVKYRNILIHILSYYKIKGTKKGYQVFFALLGYNATIIEYPPVSIRYDSGYKYDDGKIYDRGCAYCSDYEIVLSPLQANCEDPSTQSLLDPSIFPLLEQVVEFNEPINANLLAFVSKILVCDTIEVCTSEDLTITVYRVNGYDKGFSYDTPLTYDTVTIINQQVLSFTCADQVNGSFLLQGNGTDYILLGDSSSKIIIS
jgi:hypothetical protein